MKKKAENSKLTKNRSTENKKKQILVLYHVYSGICFFLVILGIFLYLEKIFISGIPFFVLILTAGILSIGVEIMKLGRGLKIIVSLLFYFILLGVIVINKPLVLSGENEIANQVLEMVNQYYHTDYLLFFVNQEQQGKTLVFLIVCALLGFLQGLLLLLFAKKKEQKFAFLFLPTLLILAGLMLGKEPTILGVLLILIGFLLSQLEFGQKGVLSLGFIMTMIVGIATVFAGSNIAQYMLKTYHKPLRKWQLQLEDKMIETVNKIDGVNYLFGKNVQSEFLLKNNKPNQSGKEIFQITVEKVPTQPLYIRGFIGGDYENGSWKKVSKQKFSDWVGEQGLSHQEGKDRVQNFPYHFLNEAENFLKNICSDPFFYKVQSQTVKMELKSPTSGYTLVPYFTNLPQKQLIEADGALLPDYQENLEWQSYLSIDETYMAMLENMILEEESQVIEFWKEYENYVEKIYTQLPQQGLERLRNYAKDNINEQLITSYYSFDIGGNAIEKETVEGWITQVRNLLHLDTSYSLNIEEVPEGKDYAEYFLLEQKKGYCVHYATTGTLLFRMYGIPARYVSGYVIFPKDFKKNKDGTYTARITDKRGHAWAEIFRENIGFCPVELTPPSYTDLLQNVEQEDILNAVEQRENLETESIENLESQQEQQQEQERKEQEAEQQREEQEKKQENNTENGQKENSSNQIKTNRNKRLAIPSIIKKIIMFFLVTTSLIMILWYRRNWVLRNRKAKFYQLNRNKAVLEMGYSIKRMLKTLELEAEQDISEKEYGTFLEKELPNMKWKQAIFILQKARFSEKGVSEEEYQKILELYQFLEQSIIQKKGKLKKWFFDLR